MLYLSGTDCAVAREMPGVGFIAQPRSYGAQACLKYETFALDNGCFTATWAERPWLRWLEKMPRERALFAVVPDVVCDADSTYWRWQHWAPAVRELGFPTAYVLQNGQQDKWVPRDADWVFIGGDTKWKLGSEAAWLAMCAAHRGQKVHMGRANSLKRLRRAGEMHCDSADGTFLRYGPEVNGPRLAHFLSALPEPQLALA